MYSDDMVIEVPIGVFEDFIEHTSFKTMEVLKRWASGKTSITVWIPTDGEYESYDYPDSAYFLEEDEDLHVPIDILFKHLPERVKEQWESLKP